MSLSSREKNFEKIYSLHFYKVWYFAFNYLGNEEQAGDVAQEVFIRVWESEENIDYSRNVLPYLITITKNICMNIFKKRSVHKKYDEYSYYSFMNSLNGEALSELPISSLYSAEVERIFAMSLDKMPAAVKETFLLSRIKGYKYREIALIQNISVKTVEWRMASAMRILQKKFKDYLPFLLWFLFP